MNESSPDLPSLVACALSLSSTYQQSSDLSGAMLERDPANILYSRANRRRLDIEMWRDAIYAAAGTLDLKVGGPSFNVSSPDANRRAVYARISRLKLNPMLALFDFPDIQGKVVQGILG